jgi:hypothetical protein
MDKTTISMYYYTHIIYNTCQYLCMQTCCVMKPSLSGTHMFNQTHVYFWLFECYIKRFAKWKSGKVVARIIWHVPEAADLCTPDDGCKGHPKHVHWFCILLCLINFHYISFGFSVLWAQSMWRLAGLFKPVLWHSDSNGTEYWTRAACQQCTSCEC